jgi:hypothetical protein
MSSESVCQVTRNWVDVGSFHTRLFGVVYFAIASVQEFLDTPSYDVMSKFSEVSHSHEIVKYFISINHIMHPTFLLVFTHAILASIRHIMTLYGFT